MQTKGVPELLRHSPTGIALNEHYDDDGAIIYKHACSLGCEGIVSKRLGLPYKAGRVSHWVKVKKPSGAGGEARSLRGMGALKSAARPRWCPAQYA